MKSFFIPFALLSLTSPLLAQNVVTAPIENVAAVVTLRTAGGLQISEARRASLASGANIVALPGLAPQIAENSLQTRFVGPGAVEVTEQSQRVASGSPNANAILRRFISKTVTLLRFISGTAGEKATTGTLLQVDEAILLDTADGVLVNPAGTFLVPRGDKLASSPRAVELGVVASAGGDYRVESNYLVEGGSWSANYRATQSVQGTRLDLRGFAALQLPGGLQYGAAQLILEPQKSDGTIQPILKLPVDLTRGNRQVAFFSGVLPVTERNVYRRTGDFTQNSDGAPTVVLRSDAPLGTALPSGPLALYREREGAPPEALSLAIAATPAESPLQISLGNVPGVTVARRVVKIRQLSPVTMEFTVEITLTNASKIPRTVEVIEPLPVNPKITEAKPQPSVNENAGTLNYSVAVGAGQAVVLRYVVESKTGE